MGTLDPISTTSQLGLSPRLIHDLQILVLHTHEVPHVRPPITPEQRLLHALRIGHPEPRRPKCAPGQCRLGIPR